MSSILSSYATPARHFTKFFDVLTGSYYDNVLNNDLPIPFTFLNGSLDININQGTDVETFINNGDTPNTTVSFQVKSMGGTYLVKTLGTNMTTWLRKLIEVQEILGSPYTGPLNIYIQPVMTKIQLADPVYGDGPLNDESVWGITSQPPSSGEYSAGNTSNNYYTCLVFKTPMTIQYEITGTGYKYFTMTSQFSAN